MSGESARKWREANPEKVREQKRKWQDSNPEKARELRRKWAKANPEKVLETSHKWIAANPEKALAHNIARKARRSGVLIATTCEKCGAGKVEAHHDDYAKPLAVRWLCRRCHGALHRKEKHDA